MSNLITLEGIDGSGKSTLWERLQQRYSNENVLFTREPTQDTWYGEAVYESIGRDDSDSLAELFLYMADHANHLHNTILPALADGTPVISDRYIDSRIAYQAATLADSEFPIEDIVGFIDQLHAPWSRYPDTTLYLSVPPKTGAQRSGETNKFENEAYLRTVKSNYETLGSHYHDRWHTLDASRSPDHVFTEATDVIDSIVGYSD